MRPCDGSWRDRGLAYNRLPADPTMNPQVLRLLDANFNRAREALRVIEDYARFVLDDEAICAELKQLRHDFTAITSKYANDAILHRDTPGDVGTDVKTQAEFERAGVGDEVVD